MLFSDPKSGDSVGIRYRAKFNRTRLVCLTIERVTPTQVVVDGKKYKRENGRRLGGDDGVFPWRAEHDAEAARAAVYDRLRAAIRALTEWTRTSPRPNLEAATTLSEAIETFLKA